MEQLLHEINWVDICLALALTGCLLVGFAMGFYRLLAIGASLGLGVVLASFFSLKLARSEFFVPVNAEFGHSGSVALAYTLILLSSVGVGLLSVLIFRRFFGEKLKVLDGLLGSVLGLGVGCAAFGLFTLGLFQLDDSRFHQPIRASYLGSSLVEGALVAGHLFPDELRTKVETGIRARLPEVAESPESSD